MKISTILKIVSVNVINWGKKLLKKKIVPYKVLINLTDLCNSRCNFCDIWKIKPVNEIQILDVEKIFKDFNKDLIWLALSGGEVTLVKYFYELVDSAKKHCPNLRIIAFTTNGLLINRTIKYAQYVKEKGFDVLITISLDGDQKVHDELRGIPGNYNKCLELYNKLRELNINCHFGLTASASNHSFIKNKYFEFKDKIRAITFVHSEGIYNKENKNEDDILEDSIKIINQNYVIKNLTEIIEKIHIKISYFFLKNKRKKNIIPCDVLDSSVHIMPNGDLKPCMFMKSLGNIRNDNLDNIISSDQYQKTRKEIKANQCPKCWMNCYSVHSIMQHPFKSLYYLFKKI